MANNKVIKNRTRIKDWRRSSSYAHSLWPHKSILKTIAARTLRPRNGRVFFCDKYLIKNHLTFPPYSIHLRAARWIRSVVHINFPNSNCFLHAVCITLRSHSFTFKILKGINVLSCERVPFHFSFYQSIHHSDVMHSNTSSSFGI